MNSITVTQIHRALVKAGIEVKEVIPQSGDKPGKIKISSRLFVHVYKNEIRVGVKKGHDLSFYLAKDQVDTIEAIKQIQQPNAQIESIPLCKKCNKPANWLNRHHVCRTCTKEQRLKQWPKSLELN